MHLNIINICRSANFKAPAHLKEFHILSLYGRLNVAQISFSLEDKYFIKDIFKIWKPYFNALINIRCYEGFLYTLYFINREKIFEFIQNANRLRELRTYIFGMLFKS